MTTRLPLLGLAALLLCSCGEDRNNSPSHAATTAQLLAPAAYPATMWTQLAQLREKHDLHINQSQQPFPSELVWQDGSALPEIGDAAAKKGGSVHLVNVGPYPAHLRTLSGLEQVFFHYTLYANIDIKLVELHPSNPQQDLIPGLAHRWAVSADGREVFFQLHPSARYSNGRPVRAADFALGLYLRSSDAIKDPFAIKIIADSIQRVTIYDDHSLGVRLREPQLLAPYRVAQLLSPAEPSFYAEFGPDYRERYAQRIVPTTGAYTVRAGDFKRNREIILSKVAQWWAADLPYYRHRYNVERRHIHFLSDEAQAWEFFLNGKLDLLQTRNISAWQERLQHPHAREGRIEKYRFRSHYPLPPYGIYLNARTLPELQLRQGLLHAMDMNRALDLLFRGEYERLAYFSEGYGSLSPRAGEVDDYQYDPARARALFAELGYTEHGADGILQRPDGTRLSVSLCYVPSEKVSSLVHQLAQSARLCGVDIISTPLSWQQCSDEVEEKRYQLAFWADVASYPLPSLDTQFHSRYLSSRGRNLHAIEDREMDERLRLMSEARDGEQLRVATRRVNQRIADLALWLPGWKENRAYVANWRHIRFPDTASCRFSAPRPYDVQEAHLFWGDEQQYPKRGDYEEVDRFINPLHD